MSGLERRLEKLTTVLRPIGCRDCAWWSSAETAICDEAGECTRPELCRTCGRFVPITDRLVVVDVDLDLV